MKKIKKSLNFSMKSIKKSFKKLALASLALLSSLPNYVTMPVATGVTAGVVLVSGALVANHYRKKNNNEDTTKQTKQEKNK